MAELAIMVATPVRYQGMLPALCNSAGVPADGSWTAAKCIRRNQPKGPRSTVVVVVIDVVEVVTVLVVEDEVVVEKVVVVSVLVVLVNVEDVEEVVGGQGIGQSARNSRCR